MSQVYAPRQTRLLGSCYEHQVFLAYLVANHDGDAQQVAIVRFIGREVRFGGPTTRGCTDIRCGVGA
jgi:hypothetical protein